MKLLPALLALISASPASTPQGAASPPADLPIREVLRLGSPLLRHVDAVTFAAFAPDDADRIVTGAADGTLALWRASDGAQVGGQASRETSIVGAALAPDGARIALALAGGAIEVRSLADGTRALLLENTGNVVAWSPDGGTLAASGLDDALRLLDAATGETRHVLSLATGGEEGLRAATVAFAPDGATVAAVGINRTKLLRREGTADEPTSVVLVADAATGTVRGRLEVPDRVVTGLAFAGDALVGSSDTGALVAWPGPGAEPTAAGAKPSAPGAKPSGPGAKPSGPGAGASPGIEVRAEGDGRPVLSFAVSPDGSHALLGHGDGTARLLSVADGAVHGTVVVGGAGVGAVAFAPDGARFVATSGFLVRAWEVEGLRELVPQVRHEGPVAGVAFSADGTRIVSGSYDHTLIRWDAASGEALDRRHASPGFVFDAAFLGERLVSGGQAGLLRLWAPEERDPLVDVVAHGAALTALAVCADAPGGAAVASVGADRTLVVWNADDGTERLRVEGLPGVRFDVAFSPDGARIAVVGADLRVLDAATGELVCERGGFGAPPTCVAWSPDGAHLAVGIANRSVFLVDPASGEPGAVLAGHSGRIAAVAFAPDGSLLASASTNERGVRLWDVGTGQQVGELTGLPRSISCLAWSPDGGRLAGGGMDGVIRIWGP